MGHVKISSMHVIIYYYYTYDRVLVKKKKNSNAMNRPCREFSRDVKTVLKKKKTNIFAFK